MKRLILVLALLWPVTLLADPHVGVDAFNRGDFATAYREWLPLAEQGLARAQHNLGALYENGWGVPRDYLEAVRWYRLAAGQGDAIAQANLGSMYGNGWGVQKNYVLSYMWNSIAAAQGHKKAAKRLEIIEKRMTPAQIAKAQDMAAKWRPKKAGSTK